MATEPIPQIRDFYAGFPPLLDVIRGYTWRLTGSILILQSFGLLAIGSLVAFWKLNFRLPMRWTVIAILCVPLLQIGATTLYVNAITNALFAIPLSALTAAFIERRALGRAEAVVSLIALAAVANIKLQFVPLSCILLAALSAYQLWRLRRDRQSRELRFFLALAVLAVLPVTFTAVANVVRFGNPLYPMAVAILGHRLPATIPLIWLGPDYLDGAPQPVKWLLSVLEYRAFEGRDLLYTIDQHSTIPVGFMPAADRPRPPGFRMGGYFLPLVLGLAVWLLILTRRLKARERLRWLAPTLLLSLLVAPLPGSNELRYFSFWMINLIFVCFLAIRHVPEHWLAFRSFVLTMFLALAIWTGGRYFDFRPYSVQDHIKANDIDQAVTGRDLCFEYRNRDPILFTDIFHNRGRYHVTDLGPGERCPDPTSGVTARRSRAQAGRGG